MFRLLSSALGKWFLTIAFNAQCLPSKICWRLTCYSRNEVMGSIVNTVAEKGGNLLGEEKTGRCGSFTTRATVQTWASHNVSYFETIFFTLMLSILNIFVNSDRMIKNIINIYLNNIVFLWLNSTIRFHLLTWINYIS